MKKLMLILGILVTVLLALWIINRYVTSVGVIFYYILAWSPAIVGAAIFIIIVVFSDDDDGETAGPMGGIILFLFVAAIVGTIITHHHFSWNAQKEKEAWVEERHDREIAKKRARERNIQIRQEKADAEERARQREIQIKEEKEAAKEKARQESIQAKQWKSYLKTPAGKVEAKINEAVILRIKLENKNREIAKVRDGFRKDIRNLRQEILRVREDRGISTYGQASMDSRINNNLSLIQTKLAYIEKLDRVEVRIKAGIEELVLHERMCEDRVEFLKVFDSEDMAGIIRGIDTTIEEYLPESGKLVVDTKGVRMKPTEDIWSDIVNGRL